MAVLLDILELLSYPLVTSQYPPDDPIDTYFPPPPPSDRSTLFHLISLALMTPNLFATLSNYAKLTESSYVAPIAYVGCYLGYLLVIVSGRGYMSEKG